MMDDYRISENFQGMVGYKMISPHHFYPTNGVPWILMESVKDKG